MKILRFLSLVAIVAMTFTGCIRHLSPERQHGGNGNTQPADPSGQGGQGQGQGSGNHDFNLSEKAWIIDYAGRETVDGQRVEVILVDGVPSGTNYLVSVINRANYATYNGDVKAFFRDELQYAGDYVYTGNSQRILFDPFRSGTWYAFIIGLDNNMELSGDYAYLMFEVEPEAPTPEYEKWLGNWTLTSGKFSYNITVSTVEPNFVYRVDGWETGNNVDVQMDLEYLETFFDDGSMYFVSQYITTYTDEDLNKDVDELFLGQVDYKGILHPQGLYIITDEGIDLAEAYFNPDGSAAIRPCRVITDIEGERYEAPFYNMQYFFTTGTDWYYYNGNVPGFPFTMKPSAAMTLRASSLRGGVQTKSAVSASSVARRGKPFVSKNERPAVKAVKVQ